MPGSDFCMFVVWPCPCGVL